MIWFHILITLLSLSITILILKVLIPFLKNKDVGQKILDDGPIWHKKKEGTPTMGGVSFVIASLVSMPLCFFITLGKNSNRESILFFNVIIFCLLNAMIGFIDDIAKVKK